MKTPQETILVGLIKDLILNNHFKFELYFWETVKWGLVPL